MNDQPKKKKNLDSVVRDLEKAREISQLGNAVPGAAPFIAEADLGIDAAETGIGLFKKLKNMFKKKK